MKIALVLLLLATSASAQTRIAFTTAPATFVDDAQKQRDRAVAALTADFTSRQKKDKVLVVADPAEAQIVITVQSMGVDLNGKATTRRGAFGGVESTANKAEHMVVELRAGDYTTTIEGWETILQTAEDQVGREIRRWLKDNAALLTH